MRTTHTTLVLLLMVILVAGAGVIAGKLMSHPAPAPPTAPTRATLSQELSLSPEQQEQMRTIWEQARDAARQCAEDARKFQHEYDDAVTRLLTPEQVTRYKELSDEAKKKTAELEDRRKAAFKKAVDSTKSILNESQRKTYEEIIKNRIGSTGAGQGVD